MTRHTLGYIGTQGEAPAEGIFAFRLNENNGEMTPIGVVAEEERPTWVLCDPQRPILYSVCEVGNRDERFGTITSFRISDQNGSLQPLSRRRTGGGSTHLTLSQDGAILYCANFGGPSAVAVPVDIDGRLGPIRSEVITHGTGPHRRQTKPHPHGVTVDPSGSYLLVPDMGADKIFVYALDDNHIRPVSTASFHAGCGPRFVLFGAAGRDAYMVAELSAEVFHLKWDDARGELTLAAVTALDPPDAALPPGAAAFGLSNDGRFLYVSNRGTHEIHCFAVSPNDGTLTQIQTLNAGGEKPWGLAISGSGDWLLMANQASDRVSSFRIDPQTGKLSASGHHLNVKTPTSVGFVPIGVQRNLG